MAHRRRVTGSAQLDRGILGSGGGVALLVVLRTDVHLERGELLRSPPRDHHTDAVLRVGVQPSAHRHADPLSAFLGRNRAHRVQAMCRHRAYAALHTFRSFYARHIRVQDYSLRYVTQRTLPEFSHEAR